MRKISEVSFTVRLTPKRSLIALVIGGLFASLTQCGVSKNDILKYYNQIRRYIPWNLANEIVNEIDNQLNQQINSDPELLKEKIRTEVDYAIITYEIEERKNRVINMKNKNILEEINKPKYDALQKLILENAVYYEFPDGTMGIRGAWVAPDPREIPLE